MPNQFQNAELQTSWRQLHSQWRHLQPVSWSRWAALKNSISLFKFTGLAGLHWMETHTCFCILIRSIRLGNQYHVDTIYFYCRYTRVIKIYTTECALPSLSSPSPQLGGGGALFWDILSRYLLVRGWSPSYLTITLLVLLPLILQGHFLCLPHSGIHMNFAPVRDLLPFWMCKQNFSNWGWLLLTINLLMHEKNHSKTESTDQTILFHCKF